MNKEVKKDNKTYLQIELEKRFLDKLPKTAKLRVQDDIINSYCPFGLELSCSKASYFDCCQCWSKKEGDN